MTFGEKLKQARSDAGLKQSELAKIIGTTNTTISNWEKGVSKPDLDMLSYICGALNVQASYFLQPIVPEGEVTIPEFNLIKKYRSLDPHGQDMVLTVLNKEYDRCLELQDNSKITQFPDRSYLDPDAAHERTDISDSDRTETSRKEEDDIMDDPNF